MTRIHLVLLWHMHQPQYRDPATRRYILPWTRLHALKDYWGMVRVLEEFPAVHATFNVVPSLAAQLEEYAGGKFDEPWFTLAFSPAEKLSDEDKAELLLRGFQANVDHLIGLWPRYKELFDRAHSADAALAIRTFALRDWRDLQLLSQLAWMDEEYLAKDADVSRLSKKGSDYTEKDKQSLRAKQLELLARVLPEYRRARDSGQIEISTTPFYHPILPLLCDTDIARQANPETPLPSPAFRHPEDAREQLVRARAYHERLFGAPPAGLWPSEGSVSNEALSIAADLGFRWFASDEGVLGRTLNIGFGRDAEGVPSNAERLYAPLRVNLGEREIAGIFRDHYLSDLVGFVYSRMDAVSAAEDLYRRMRIVAERVQSRAPLTLPLILDGENAWEYYPGNGREFLRHFYGRISRDPDIRALTVSEALREAGEIATVKGIAPGSWINANFDVWIGHKEDVTAWELLARAREFYAQQLARREGGEANAPGADQLSAAFEALLMAEGSDWCWWFGPEHSSANDEEFDAFFRQLLSEAYQSLGRDAPDELAEPIKQKPAPAHVTAPSAFLDVRVDGRESTYFEWLGAGLYSPDRQGSSMHGRVHWLHQFRYGFSSERFYIRVDFADNQLAALQDAEFRITLRGEEELRIVLHAREGKLRDQRVETKDTCLWGPQDMVIASCDRILEVSVARKLLRLGQRNSFSLVIALWEGGLPVDLLPAEGWFEVALGEDHFAWAIQ
ncbi:MAG: glycoside hydrolase [Acidobacteria bacterium]|nr:MAG: glycoside hydrolase [Acidobacteriota bacterium]